jgi:inosose dehydratase
VHQQLRVGCQTYTWQALHEQGRWRGDFANVLDAIAEAGYEGVETTPAMLGPLFDRPSQVGALLADRGLELAALAVSAPTGWTDPSAERDELALVQRAIEFLAGVGPRQRLALGGGRIVGATQQSASASVSAFAQMVRVYHLAARLAVARGQVVNVHPTSAPGSLIRTRDDYERLVAALDPALISLGPDTGHITRGDESAVAFVGRHLHRITHVHVKDAEAGADGAFAFMGTGDANIPAVVEVLRRGGYQGWLIAEEESPEGICDPPASVRACRRYLRHLGC